MASFIVFEKNIQNIKADFRKIQLTNEITLKAYILTDLLITYKLTLNSVTLVTRCTHVRKFVSLLTKLELPLTYTQMVKKMFLSYNKCR